MSTNPNEVLHLFKWFCAFDPDSPIANLNLNAFDTQAGETDPVHVKQEEVLSIQHRRTSTRGRMGESFLKRRDEFIKSGVWEQVRKGERAFSPFVYVPHPSVTYTRMLLEYKLDFRYGAPISRCYRGRSFEVGRIYGRFHV